MRKIIKCRCINVYEKCINVFIVCSTTINGHSYGLSSEVFCLDRRLLSSYRRQQIRLRLWSPWSTWNTENCKLIKMAALLYHVYRRLTMEYWLIRIQVSENPCVERINSIWRPAAMSFISPWTTKTTFLTKLLASYVISLGCSSNITSCLWFSGSLSVRIESWTVPTCTSNLPLTGWK